jgi:glycosyltransferase involved in cell wall biosynthesis
MDSVAIAMSIYKADKFLFIKECIESLKSQTYKNLTVFIMVDGQVNNEVENYLKALNNNVFFNITFNSTNLGLAKRLNQIIDKVLAIGSYTYIARMDADDVCEPLRIEKQVNFLGINPEISVVGTDLIEINFDGVHLFYKSMAKTNEILVKNIIKKCPFNHPTVMFRTTVFLNSNVRYKAELMNTQDYYLWVDLVKAGYLFANINEPLLKFRIDENFHTRRGLKKAINDLKARFYAFKVLRNFSMSNLLHVTLLFALRISPATIKKIAYKKLR